MKNKWKITIGADNDKDAWLITRHDGSLVAIVYNEEDAKLIVEAPLLKRKIEEIKVL